jgi:hypothetical protein
VPGPRHFDFHPEENFIYVISELNSTITILKSVGENWEEIQAISTLQQILKAQVIVLIFMFPMTENMCMVQTRAQFNCSF